MNDSSLKYEPNMNISTLSKRVLILFHILFCASVCVKFSAGSAICVIAAGFTPADDSGFPGAYRPE